MVTLITGSAVVNFGFESYSSKDEILVAISNLQQLSGTGNDVAGALETMKTSIFTKDSVYQCPLRTGSQCVALIIYSENADNKTLVTDLQQVSACVVDVRHCVIHRYRPAPAAIDDSMICRCVNRSLVYKALKF